MRTACRGAIGRVEDDVWAGPTAAQGQGADRAEYPRLAGTSSSRTSTSRRTSRSRARSATSGIAAVAYETVETDRGALPLLAPMSEVAGAALPPRRAQNQSSRSRRAAAGDPPRRGVAGVAGARARDRRRHGRLQRRGHRARHGRAGDDSRERSVDRMRFLGRISLRPRAAPHVVLRSSSKRRSRTPISTIGAVIIRERSHRSSSPARCSAR